MEREFRTFSSSEDYVSVQSVIGREGKENVKETLGKEGKNGKKISLLSLKTIDNRQINIASNRHMCP